MNIKFSNLPLKAISNSQIYHQKQYQILKSTTESNIKFSNIPLKAISNSQIYATESNFKFSILPLKEISSSQIYHRKQYQILKSTTESNIKFSNLPLKAISNPHTLELSDTDFISSKRVERK
jgi:hypothetical protein